MTTHTHSRPLAIRHQTLRMCSKASESGAEASGAGQDERTTGATAGASWGATLLCAAARLDAPPSSPGPDDQPPVCQLLPLPRPNPLASPLYLHLETLRSVLPACLLALPPRTSGKVSSTTTSRVLRAAARAPLGMSAAAVQPGAIRKVHSSPKAKAGGLQILGAAAKEAGGDDKAPKASGAGAGKPPPPGARPKKPKPKAAAAAGDQPASTQAEPGWKAKQAAKNRAAAAGDEGGGSGAGSSRQHVEPLRTTNRARALPSFGTHGKAPAPMYSSPWLPSSYSSTTDPRATAPPALESHSPLHRQVLESWVASQPRPATLEARKAALDKVARAVSRFEGSYQLALFGSVANGVDNDASDLDICVIVSPPPRRAAAPHPSS